MSINNHWKHNKEYFEQHCNKYVLEALDRDTTINFSSGNLTQFQVINNDFCSPQNAATVINNLRIDWTGMRLLSSLK